LRTDLDDATAALLALSAANWAYTWLRAGAETDELADRFTALLLDGMRGYATR
jgi:TetR/AcrR family transcriptional regulator, cholesterol catabolism regulator